MTYILYHLQAILQTGEILCATQEVI